MCLSAILPEEEKKEILDKMTRKWITVYKVVEVYNGEYHSIFITPTPPYKGKMEAEEALITTGTGYRTKDKKYTAGFHCFLNKVAAQGLRDAVPERLLIVIKVKIRKEWITEIGTESGYNNAGYRDWKMQEIVIVAKKAVFPKFKK